MSNSSNKQSAESFFGEAISIYTRAQAIEDGVLIDTGSMAQEAGFKWPVALTTGAWVDCIAWTEEDSGKQVHQDQSGRLWDVVFMASHAIQTRSDSGDQMLFQLYRIPRDGRSTEAKLVT